MPTVFVVGSLNADQLLEVTACPEAGQTVLASNARVSAGGKGGNQAVAAARAGADVVMVGALGDDAHGRLVRRELDGSGVDTGRVRVTERGTPTGTAVVLLDQDGENRIIVAPGANAQLSRRDVDLGLASFAEGDLLLLQLETPPAVVAYAARLASQRGGVVVLNAAPAPTDAVCLNDDLDYLVVNRGEMAAVATLLGLAAPEEAAAVPVEELVDATARALGCVVVCTTGADGSYANVGGEVAHIPAVRVPVTDTTAAGDTYTGYLAAALAAGGRALPEALGQASAAAALAVTRTGAMSSIPRARELEQATDSGPARAESS